MLTLEEPAVTLVLRGPVQCRQRDWRWGREMGREQAKRMTALESGSHAIGPIVSSAQLATGALPGLSEVEFGLILAGHAFDRWMVRCMGAALGPLGVPDLSAVEVLVLHTVRHRDRPTKFADICLVLGIEDTHVVSYAIKKLTLAGLVTSKKAGKEKL